MHAMKQRETCHRMWMYGHKKKILCDALNWIIQSANHVGYLSQKKKKKNESSIITWLQTYLESKKYHYWDAIAVSLYSNYSEGEKKKKAIVGKKKSEQLSPLGKTTQGS